ncbi:unnamed protein product [Psylliodes chrysocephalus]|uniref:Uncharacterized protein n=1 Tax=Psylliodes chrysocephalus TaxID=3402493 RepID=A0A9P0CYH3_9CUCU|nr:unnamed protein product [Psylliodes chrysocephala]
MTFPFIILKYLFIFDPPKSSERLPRALATYSPDVIFDETTIALVAQDKFLLNDRNKVRLIDMLKVYLEKNKILTLQADEDADILMVTTAISISSSYEVVKIVGEDIYSLVLYCGLLRYGGDHMLSTNRPNNNNIFVKCGRGKNTDVIYSTNSFTQLSQLGIALFFYAFSDCDTSAPFGQGKKKFLSTIKK